MKRIFLIALLFCLLAAAHPTNAQDSSPMAYAVGNGTATSCTESALRAAVRDNKVITFNCGPNPVTIPLTKELVIQDERVIHGGGKITLDGQGKTRIIKVVPYRALMITGMTLKNGRANYDIDGDDDRSGEGQGGAIFVDVWSDLTVQNVTFQNNKSLSPKECSGGGAIRLNGFNYAEVLDSSFTGNTAPNGGAINNLTSDLIIRGSTFDSNQATHDLVNFPTNFTGCSGGGGAIFIDGANRPDQGGVETISITHSIFRDNRTLQSGGAIFSYLYSREVLTVDQSTFEGNRALFTLMDQEKFPAGAGMGGALYWNSERNEAARIFKGKYVVTNSTFSGNHADRMGGAMYVGRSTLEMTNTTIANNEAANNLSTLAYRGKGGGVYLRTGTTNDPPLKSIISNVTIAYNAAGYVGGGIGGGTGQDSMLTGLKNSVIANNTAAGSSTGAASNCEVTLTNQGGNVQSDGSTRCASSILIKPANLGSLGDHGGLTKTVPLQSGSPAINRGVAGCPAVDQRGYARNGVCDSGAFEYDALELNNKLFLPFIKK